MERYCISSHSGVLGILQSDTNSVRCCLLIQNRQRRRHLERLGHGEAEISPRQQRDPSTVTHTPYYDSQHGKDLVNVSWTGPWLVRWVHTVLTLNCTVLWILYVRV